MWRRFNRDDLEASNPLVSSSHAPFLRCIWPVYDQYSVYQFRGEGEETRFYGISENARVKLRYQPLVDTPYLFLEFARQVEAKNAPESLREWVRKRGLLGLHNNSARGGPGEILDDIWTHASLANDLLIMYEAALSRDLEKLRQVFDPETGPWSVGPGLVPLLIDELGALESEQSPASRDEVQEAWENRERMWTITDMSTLQYVMVDVGLDDFEDNVDSLAEVAMRIVVERVQNTLAPLVRPSFGTLAPTKGEAHKRWWQPELLTRSWVPMNLLGAMYLQFYWAMTSSGDLYRCKYCDRIISRASSSTGSGQTRKPRSDKVFCSSRCRQNYHYNNRIKPARQANTKKK